IRLSLHPQACDVTGAHMAKELFKPQYAPKGWKYRDAKAAGMLRESQGWGGGGWLMYFGTAADRARSWVHAVAVSRHGGVLGRFAGRGRPDQVVQGERVRLHDGIGARIHDSALPPPPFVDVSDFVPSQFSSGSAGGRLSASPRATAPPDPSSQSKVRILGLRERGPPAPL